MKREEAIKLIEHISIAFVPTDQYGDYDDPLPYEEALGMAIEALSAEVVHKPDYSYEADMVRRLKEALSADRPTGWIPCSERLPSAEDCPMDCMVTRRSQYVGNYTDMAVAEADGTWTHEDWKAITINGKATCISTRDADIIAWMPMPEPYKGGDDE